MHASQHLNHNRQRLTSSLQGEGLLHRAAAAVGLASDKAQETKEAAKDQASKGCVVPFALACTFMCASKFSSAPLSPCASWQVAPF
jgi:hypothetical protein